MWGVSVCLSECLCVLNKKKHFKVCFSLWKLLLFLQPFSVCLSSQRAPQPCFPPARPQTTALHPVNALCRQVLKEQDLPACGGGTEQGHREGKQPLWTGRPDRVGGLLAGFPQLLPLVQTPLSSMIVVAASKVKLNKQFFEYFDSTSSKCHFPKVP